MPSEFVVRPPAVSPTSVEPLLNAVMTFPSWSIPLIMYSPTVRPEVPKRGVWNIVNVIIAGLTESDTEGGVVEYTRVTGSIM